MARVKRPLTPYVVVHVLLDSPANKENFYLRSMIYMSSSAISDTILSFQEKFANKRASAMGFSLSDITAGV